MHRTLRLGRECGVYGRYDWGETSKHVAWAISVGADKRSPSREFKGDLAIPNEDGLLVIEDGAKILLAVADAHFGHEASHDLLTALAEGLSAPPATPEELAEWFSALSTSESPGVYASRTSLVVAVHDRTAQAGFGLSFGDSTVTVVGAEHGGEPVHERNHDFVTRANPPTLVPGRGVAFSFEAGPEDLVLAFTDGIDQCHYRHPDTSVTPRHLRALYAETGPRPAPFARRLVELALAGVDGHPGGQDNIALLVCGA